MIAEELMMPILGVVKAKDFEDAVEKAVWLEHGNQMCIRDRNRDSNLKREG